MRALFGTGTPKEATAIRNAVVFDIHAQDSSSWPSGTPVVREVGVTSHILSDRRVSISSSPLAAAPLLARSGFVQ
jgi:hypothetical protein